jgi:hypothetical protein
LSVHPTAADVAAVEKRITDLQNRAHAIVHDQPLATFSPTT